MSKPYPVHWTREADISYLETLTFILENWSLKEAERFDLLTHELLINLSNNLKLCPEIPDLKVRKCVISEQSSLINRIVSKSVELVGFVDNRSKHRY